MKIIDMPGHGPAFPHQVTDFKAAYFPGITIRDYFIVHAPELPQAWFRPVMPTPCPPRQYVSNDDKTHFASVKAADDACGMDGYYDQNAGAIDQWRQELKKQTAIQWPAAWADEQLKLRAAWAQQEYEKS